MTDEVTPGGIIIPDAVRKHENQGVVLAVGPGDIDGSADMNQFEVGDRIAFTHCLPVVVDEKKFFIVKAECVMAIIGRTLLEMLGRGKSMVAATWDPSTPAEEPIDPRLVIKSNEARSEMIGSATPTEDGNRVGVDPGTDDHSVVTSRETIPAPLPAVGSSDGTASTDPPKAPESCSE